jgi:hypothetical protein
VEKTTPDPEDLSVPWTLVVPSITMPILVSNRWFLPESELSSFPEVYSASRNEHIAPAL